MCGDQTFEAYSRVGRTKVLLGSWSDYTSQEGHSGVCFLRDVINMLTPGKVATYGDSQVF